MQLCDDCPSAFCSICINRNCGADALQELKETDLSWSCLKCKPEQLQEGLVFAQPQPAPAGALLLPAPGISEGAMAVTGRLGRLLLRRLR